MKIDHQTLLERYRYYSDSKAVVCVFEHGTVTCCTKSKDAAVTLLQQFDVPGDGEGSEFGDVHPLTMDDGATVFAFRWPHFYVSARLTEAEMAHVDLTPISATEVFQHADLVLAAKLLPHVLATRHRRGLDARGLNMICYYDPAEVGGLS